MFPGNLAKLGGFKRCNAVLNRDFVLHTVFLANSMDFSEVKRIESFL